MMLVEIVLDHAGITRQTDNTAHFRFQILLKIGTQGSFRPRWRLSQLQLRPRNCARDMASDILFRGVMPTADRFFY